MVTCRAPQVYFVSETAMNLESEIARGAKLKCSCCGKKGAALGCYCKSCRRSYHFPCAAKIEGCRWDYVSFSFVVTLIILVVIVIVLWNNFPNN